MIDQRGFTYYLLPGRRIPDDVSTIAPPMQLPQAPPEPLPWQRGLLWLLFLGSFFLISYGLSNWWTATYGTPGNVVFDWEREIPFLAWTVVPYWSIDLLYGFSFLFCRTRREVDRHALRLLTAQIVSVACFIAFPLRFAFDRPETSGAFGWMFSLLMGLDKPFNQAPSLHISLLVILWLHYAALVPKGWRWAVHLWSGLTAFSVLTTYQHHFIDLPTGVLAGAFCLWLWPERQASPMAHLRFTSSPERRRLAGSYLFGAAACAIAACSGGGAALWLLWLAVAFGLVAFNYAWVGADGFQKDRGHLSCGAALLLAPYLIGVWLNSRLWTHRHPEPDEIADGVWLGRLPTEWELADHRFAALLDATAELPAPPVPRHYANLSWLDHVTPSHDQLATAAYQIARLRRKGPVLVCCTHGYTRSACAVAAWLLATGRAASVDQAIARIAAHRPGIALSPAHRLALESLLIPALQNA